MRICKFCNIKKDESEFSIKSPTTKRRSSKCKDCHNKYVREVWYPKNSQKQIDSNREWKKRNPRKVFMQRYPFLSSEDVVEHLSKTNCDICGSKEGLVLDHCHTTNKYRGTLCGMCNRGLGLFYDNISLLENAITYLKKYT